MFLHMPPVTQFVNECRGGRWPNKRRCVGNIDESAGAASQIGKLPRETDLPDRHAKILVHPVSHDNDAVQTGRTPPVRQQ